MIKFFKYLKFSFYILLLAIIVVSIGFNFYQYNEVSRLNQIYSITQANLNQNVVDKEFTIQNLQESFDKLNKEVESLRVENIELNSDLKNLKSLRFGTLSGSVVGFIGENGIQNQSQLVCAQSIKNIMISYCTTTSTIGKNYLISLPAGSYYVFAKLFDGQNTIGEKQGWFTEYVQCYKKNNSESKCERNEVSKKPYPIEIKPGEVIENIDPVDWF